MTATHDIYDPPPAPVPLEPPRAEKLTFTWGDLACLVLLCALLCSVAVASWWSEPFMAVLTALGVALVVIESWYTALGFLHRARPLGVRARWTVFLAALLPWLVGLGISAALMLGFFWISDLLL
jgi:hypothetical protein